MRAGWPAPPDSEKAECHRHAVAAIVSRDEYRGSQPKACRMLRASATSAGASPGLRGAYSTGTVRPEIRSTISTTCFTEWPVPVPQLNLALAPPPSK